MIWKPISTAPKDRDILLWYPQVGGAIQGAWFLDPKQIDDGWLTVIGSLGKPTLWTELTEPDDEQ